MVAVVEAADGANLAQQVWHLLCQPLPLVNLVMLDQLEKVKMLCGLALPDLHLPSLTTTLGEVLVLLSLPLLRDHVVGVGLVAVMSL
jgi:hypothetical protein